MMRTRGIGWLVREALVQVVGVEVVLGEVFQEAIVLVLQDCGVTRIPDDPRYCDAFLGYFCISVKEYFVYRWTPPTTPLLGTPLIPSTVPVV